MFATIKKDAAVYVFSKTSFTVSVHAPRRACTWNAARGGRVHGTRHAEGVYMERGMRRFQCASAPPRAVQPGFPRESCKKHLSLEAGLTAAFSPSGVTAAVPGAAARGLRPGDCGTVFFPKFCYNRFMIHTPSGMPEHVSAQVSVLQSTAVYAGPRPDPSFLFTDCIPGGKTMFFYMPAKVYCENNCVRAHAKELASFSKKALIVTGRSSAFKNGSIADVQAALADYNVDCCVFNEVEENPSVETVMKGRDRGLAEGVDFVIGIGGGSPMDAAKAIALMIRRKDDGPDYLYDSSAVTDALPVVCIPTTCGTGSEVTAVSVLSRPSKRAKGSIPHKIFPRLSLLDGKYLLSAPRRVIVDTSIDALSHMYESYLNSKATDCSRMCVDAGLKIWSRSRKVILSGAPLSSENCTDMLLASMFAGMAIAHTGTSLPHAMSYPVTVETGMPHGKACGFFLTGYLREADPDDVAYLLNTVGFTDADSLETYYQATCGRDEVPAPILRKSVDAPLSSPAKLAMAPFAVTEATLCRIAGLK